MSERESAVAGVIPEPEAPAGGMWTGGRDNGLVVLIECPAGCEQITMGER